MFAHIVISIDILLPRLLIPMQPIFHFDEDVILHAETCRFSTISVGRRQVKDQHIADNSLFLDSL